MIKKKIYQYLFELYELYNLNKNKFLYKYYLWQYYDRMEAPSFKFGQNFSLIFKEKGGFFKTGYSVEFRNFCNIFIQRGSVSIGNNVFFNNYCSINCLSEIIIGENTIFGEGVKLYDHNHLYKISEGIINISRDQFKISPIRIGKNTWIGSNVTILQGVSIGDNVIVGANNLIYKSIPSNVIIKSTNSTVINNVGESK